MPTPLALSSPIRAKSRSASRSDSAAVGSSMSRTRAPVPRARAISTSCCSAMRSEPARRVEVEGGPHAGEKLVGPAPPLAPVDAPPGALGLEAHGHVLGHGEVGEERRLLVDGSDAQGAGEEGSARPTTSPPTTRRPESGAWAPVMILTSVLLPAPFSPTRAWTSPARRVRETSRRACTPANDFETWSSVEDVRHGEAILPQVRLLRGRPKWC